MKIRTDPAAPVGRAVQGLAPADRAVPVEAADMGPGVRAVLVDLAPVGPAARVVPVDLDPAARVAPADPVAVRVLAAPVVRVDLRVLVVPVGLKVLVARVVPVDLRVLVARVVPVDLKVLVARVVPVDLKVLVARVDPRVLAVRADMVRVVPVGLRGLVVPAVLVLVARVVPVDTARADPVVPGDLVVLGDRVVPVDLRHLRTSNAVSMTAVARNGADPTMRRTASVPRTTARHRRRLRADSAGTVDPLPARRRPTGTGRHLLEAGTDRRLPEAGTDGGMDRHATSVTASAISGRSPTTDSTPSRSSTRCSAVGASGTSALGFRCTDLI